MRSILYIAGLFPPISNSGTQRSLKFVNYLPDFGWNPIVLTADNHQEVIDNNLLNEVRPSIQVERVSFTSYVIAKYIDTIFCIHNYNFNLTEKLEWRIRNTWNIPDEWAMWRYTATKKAVDLFQKNEFDCILASGFPWTSFLIANDVSKITGKPFILDYRDLWNNWETEWNKKKLYIKFISRILENKVLNNASAIIATTDSMIEVLRNKSKNNDKCKFACITNGYDSIDFKVKSASKNSLDKIRIVYTGVWKKGYSPKILYDTIRKIQQEHPNIAKNIELICAGFTPGTYEHFSSIKDIVTELGRVSHAKAISLMKSADVLFLTVSEGKYASGSIPGKFFEYLGTGRPIIALAPFASEVAKLVDKIGGHKRLDPLDINGLTEVLIHIALNKKSYFGEPDLCSISSFERRNLTRQLAELIDSITINP